MTELKELIAAKMDVLQLIDFLDLSFEEVIDALEEYIDDAGDALWKELG